MRKITAKHNAICPECGCAIYAGDKVYWEPDFDMIHSDCYQLKIDRIPKIHISRKTKEKRGCNGYIKR